MVNQLVIVFRCFYYVDLWCGALVSRLPFTVANVYRVIGLNKEIELQKLRVLLVDLYI